MAEGWYFIAPDAVSYQLDQTSVQRILQSIGNIGMAPVENLRTRGPQQHGETFRDFRLRPRIIPIAMSVLGLTQPFTDHQTWLAAMKPYANASILRREMADASQYELDVRFHAGLSDDLRDIQEYIAPTYAIQLIAFDPVWRKLPLQTQTFSLAALTELTFPITFSIEFGSSTITETVVVAVSGTWWSHPTIVLTGPLTTPTITNSSVGQKIQLNYNIPAGRVVTIDLDPGTKTIEDDLGTNLIGTLSTDSDLFGFHLGVAPEVSGGNNTILVQAGGAVPTSGIAMNWYNKYIGL